MRHNLKCYSVTPRVFTLRLLLSPYHCEWVAGYLSRSEGHKTEEEQFGVTVVGWIPRSPAHNGL